MGRLSLATTLALILAAWFVPLLGAILVLITAYQQPKPQDTPARSADERPLAHLPDPALRH